MAGKTLHVATGGTYVPIGNLGSNPLSQATSGYHLGPDEGIFSVSFAPDTGRLSQDILFSASNPLLVSIDSGSLSIVHGAISTNKMRPLDLRLLIDGVSYKIPDNTAKRIRAKNGGRVFWKTSSGASGSFLLYRSAPPVFR